MPALQVSAWSTSSLPHVGGVSALVETVRAYWCPIEIYNNNHHHHITITHIRTDIKYIFNSMSMAMLLYTCTTTYFLYSLEVSNLLHVSNSSWKKHPRSPVSGFLEACCNVLLCLVLCKISTLTFCNRWDNFSNRILFVLSVWFSPIVIDMMDAIN